jgi:hypothetical protein
VLGVDGGIWAKGARWEAAADCWTRQGCKPGLRAQGELRCPSAGVPDVWSGQLQSPSLRYVGTEAAARQAECTLAAGMLQKAALWARLARKIHGNRRPEKRRCCRHGQRCLPLRRWGLRGWSE